MDGFCDCTWLAMGGFWYCRVSFYCFSLFVYFGFFFYCLYLFPLFLFFSLFLWLRLLFFAFCEHGHASLWFGILFSFFPFLFLLLLFIVFFLGTMGKENKEIPNAPYSGFRDDADSTGVVGKTKEVCMGEFICLLQHNFMVPCIFNLTPLLRHDYIMSFCLTYHVFLFNFRGNAGVGRWWSVNETIG